MSTASHSSPTSAVHPDVARHLIECVGSHHGQVDLVARALDRRGEMLGHIAYNKFEDGLHLSMVEVDPSKRRQGIAMGLLRHIQADDPQSLIVFGGTTDDGEGLRRAWHRGDAIRRDAPQMGEEGTRQWAKAYRTGASAWYVDTLTSVTGSEARSSGTGERWSDGQPLPPSVRGADSRLVLGNGIAAHRSSATPRFLFSAAELAVTKASLRHAASETGGEFAKQAEAVEAHLTRWRSLPGDGGQALTSGFVGDRNLRRAIGISCGAVTPEAPAANARSVVVQALEVIPPAWQLASWYPECFPEGVSAPSRSRMQDFQERLAGRAQSSLGEPAL